MRARGYGIETCSCRREERPIAEDRGRACGWLVGECRFNKETSQELRIVCCAWTNPLEASRVYSAGFNRIAKRLHWAPRTLAPTKMPGPLLSRGYGVIRIAR